MSCPVPSSCHDQDECEIFALSARLRGEREGTRRIRDGKVRWALRDKRLSLGAERPVTYLTPWTGYMSDRFLGSFFVNFAP